MSKRRRASELLFGSKYALRYPAKVYTVTSGTGTLDSGGGNLIVVASNVATRCYITITTDTNIGTLVGTAAQTPTHLSGE